MKTITLHCTLSPEHMLELLDMLEELHHTLWDAYQEEFEPLLAQGYPQGWSGDQCNAPCGDEPFNDEVPF